MAFWRQEYSYHSPIPEILEKEAFTLEELLDEEGLIQETKSANGKLLEYLSQADQISSLLTYIVQPATAGESHPSLQPTQDAKRAFKYPYVACEVFCCNSDSIMQSFLSNEDLLSKLFSALDLPRPLNCVLAGYFSRVALVVYQRCQENCRENETTANPVAAYLKQQPELLSKMIYHVENTSIAEILEVYLGFHDFVDDIQSHDREWMAATPVIDNLLKHLSPEANSDSQRNAAQILSQAAQAHRLPLSQRFASQQYLSRVFELAFSPNVSMEALNVCIALLKLGPTQWFNSLHSTFLGAVKEIIHHLPDLKKMLQGRGPVPGMQTPFGVLNPPLGSLRLKAVEMVLVLVSVDDASIRQGLFEYKLIPILLDLFVKYPYNNILHNLVLRAVLFILKSESEALMQHLYQDCKFASWLCLAPEEIEHPTGDPKRKMRAGYLGHITIMGRTLVQLVRTTEAGKKAVSELSQFNAWAEQTLKGRMEKEDTELWTFGRPPSRKGTSTVASVDELDGFGEDEDEGASAMVALSTGRYAGSPVEDEDEEDEYWPAFAPRNEVLQANDPTAAFRTLQLGDGYNLDSSSSSSSDDDVPMRPRQRHSGAEDDAVVVGSNSDEEVDIDSDAVMVSMPIQSMRLPPSDAGFTDFDDFGGFQANDSPPSETREDLETAAETAPPDSHHWNAFSDPTDAGWAAFPSDKPSINEPQSNGQASWDPFGSGASNPSPAQDQPSTQGVQSREMEDNRARHANSQAGGQDGAGAKEDAKGKDPDDSEGEPNPSQEFSNFSFWRQPVEEIVDE